MNYSIYKNKETGLYLRDLKPKIGLYKDKIFKNPGDYLDWFYFEHECGTYKNGRVVTSPGAGRTINELFEVILDHFPDMQIDEFIYHLYNFALKHEQVAKDPKNHSKQEIMNGISLCYIKNMEKYIGMIYCGEADSVAFHRNRYNSMMINTDELDSKNIIINKKKAGRGFNFKTFENTALNYKKRLDARKK